jgi:hypothetical protein
VPDRSAIEAGLDFEQRFAETTGSDLVPASGSQWYAKLDAEGLSVLWSLKNTTKRTFSLTQALIDEGVVAVDAPGGKGDNTIPGWGVHFADEDLVVLRLDDFVRVLGEGRKLVTKSKEEARYEHSRIPALLRD